ncbi:MAG: type III pantothenate kinase [Pacificimonas sp.]
MLLAIDVGNTNSVFALIEGQAVVHSWRIATNPNRTGDEYMVWLSQLLELARIDKAKIDRVLISSVVPPTIFNLGNFARHYLSTDPLIVTKDLDIGVGIDVPSPSEVGADRLVNSAAAHAAHGDGLIVIDFGTATTFDMVVGNAYAGGVIAPGINLAVDALYSASAQLPRVAVAPPSDNRAWAKGTVNAMQSGIFYGYLGLIEGLVARLKKEAARDLKVIATGGLAPIFEEHTEIIDAVDTDLTVRGLALIASRN